MSVKRFQRRVGRPLAKVGRGGRPMSMPVDTTVKEIDIGAIDHFWHPDRDGVEFPDERFQQELATMTDRVVVCRPPAGAPLIQKRSWLIWMRKPSVTHPLSPGWMLLIDWRLRGEPMSLDMRVFSYLYSVSITTHGSAKAYFDKCVAEMERDKAAKQKVHTDDCHDRSQDYLNFTKVKNIGRGNKYALHLATDVPSRGTQNWLDENRKRMIPSEVAANEARR